MSPHLTLVWHEVNSKSSREFSISFSAVYEPKKYHDSALGIRAKGLKIKLSMQIVHRKQHLR